MLLRSIRVRMLGLLLATVVPFTALVGAGLWNQWKADEAVAVERALNEARLLAADVDDHIGNLENLLTGISSAVSTNPADTSANDALLRQIKSELPNYVSNILLFSLDGSNIGTSWNAEAERPHGSDRRYFQQILAGQHFSVGEVIIGRPHGEWLLALARPVKDREGQLQGVLAVGTRLERFQDALRIGRLPASSVVRIVDENGIVVARSANSPNWIGRDLSRWQSVRRHLAAKETTDVLRWSDGDERITASSTAHRVSWLVTVGLPADTAFAMVASRLRWGALISGATLALAFAIAWLVSGRIVRPLRQLREDALALAAGDLGHRSKVKTADEIGVLANTFNQMAQSLEKRREETERAANEVRRAKDTLAAVIDASPVAIVCSDLQRRVRLWNRAAEKMFGYGAEEVVGHPAKIIPPELDTESQHLFKRAAGGETYRDVRLRRMRKDGSLIDVSVAAAPMYNPDGTVRGVARAYEDITERKKAEERLTYLAHYDQLTGLPNRVALQQELEDLLARPGDQPPSIALLDLDNFKDVNDAFGHSVGDQLLVEVACRLKKFAEAYCEVSNVCRLGGDDFVVVIPGSGDPRAVTQIVEAMLKRLVEPYQINGQVFHSGACAGIVLGPDGGSNPDELIANADLALYQAKAAGSGSHRLFLPVLRAQAHARHNLDVELRRALAQSEFELFFQPQIQLSDNTVAGAEALLRWRHPVRGILAPGAFIETLAESSIAADVGRWVVRAACEQAAAWRARGLPLGRMAANLFPVQVRGGALLKDVEEALRQTGLPPDALELEITESIALTYGDASKPLEKLREAGVKLSFDDFGTGYASLSYLTRFPISRIKIDRRFVANLDSDGEDAAIVRSLIVMAHNLGLGVIAEGVETMTQAGFLLDNGCEEAQGFLYAQPLPAAEFEQYLQTSGLAALESIAVDEAGGRSVRALQEKSRERSGARASRARSSYRKAKGSLRRERNDLS